MVFTGNRHRALSTVVTTAILLSFVAMIGTSVVAWSNTNSRAFESILVTSASDSLNKINEMLIIENVVLQSKCILLGYNGVNTTVTNTGTVGINVTQIKISDSTQTATYTKSDFRPSPYNPAIMPQSSKSICVVYPWQTGYLTTVQVTTARGTVLTTQVIK